jgi:putative DNA primase/helicase
MTQHSPNLDNLLARLEGVRANGAGYMAKCPAHADNNPSLSVNLNSDGTILLNCFADCTPEAVLSACGLTFKDLYSDRDRTRVREATPRRNAPSKASAPPSGRTSPGYNSSGPSSPSTVHPYEDRDGSPLFRVLRFNQTKGKTFRLERYDGQGAWIPKLDGVRRVLYHLPDVVQAIGDGRRVYVVEGEKNADDLAQRGLVTTTNPQGAGKWNTYGDGYTQALKGADVVVLYDNDRPGHKHRDDVTRSLYGIAQSVRVVDLPNMAEGDDVSEWLERGGSVEELERLADQAPEWSPELQTLSHANLVRASDVKPESVEWLWPHYIPRSKITMADGDPGLAKSTVFLDLAARVSTGRPLPDGHTIGEPANVIVLSYEDGIADTIVPRLIAAGADLSRVYILSAILNDAREEERMPELPTDIPILAAAIRSKKAAFVIIDPLMACLSSEIDSHRDQDVRRAMTPLKKLAEETGAAIVIIRHCSKSAGVSAIHKGSGSVGLIGASRLGMLFAKDPDAQDSGRVIVAVTKSNLGPIPPALVYRIETDEAHGCGRIVWEGTTNHKAEDLTGLPMDRGERGAQAEAEEFIREELRNGPVTAAAILKAAAEMGIAVRTLKRAKPQAGAVSFISDEGIRMWGYASHKQETQAATDAKAGTNTPTGSDAPAGRAGAAAESS